MKGDIHYEEEFRAYLAAKRGKNNIPISKGSVKSYVCYLEAVAWGLGVPITPELVHSRGNDEILAKAKIKPLRRKKGKKPADDYVENWRAALERYREMCEEKGL